MKAEYDFSKSKNNLCVKKAMKSSINIGDIPAVIWGETSNSVYLYIHGQGGNKDEAEWFGNFASHNGWQVISVDLPGHGQRISEIDMFNPWHINIELKQVSEYVHHRWENVALYAVSIGAWFSMLSFANESLSNCLFISPVLDMVHIIENMMLWANVTESQLEQEGEIPTDFGQTLSWEYFQYAKSNPITKWDTQTNILYPQEDHLTKYDIALQFSEKFGCQLEIAKNAKHLLHSPEELELLHQFVQRHF